jgi:IS66 Orf2 like protein.
MLGNSQAVQVWARAQPTDLRLGFHGLAGLVETEFHRQVHSGDLFLFVNRRRSSAKILLWDGSGMCVYAKKLAPGRGSFACLWRQSVGGPPLRLTAAELNLFLERPVVRNTTSRQRKKGR